MSEKRNEQDRSFDDEQQQIFGNDKAAPEATRPPVGTDIEPVVPGVGGAGSEGTNDEKKPPAK